jgi:hypothetical protein
MYDVDWENELKFRKLKNTPPSPNMLGSLGAPASSTTKTGRHDITERDVFTLLSAIAFYIEVFYVILSRVHLSIPAISW